MSNFYGSTIAYEGKLWKSVEHAYQAAKTLNQEHRDLILSAPTPGMAKKLGKIVPLRPDWDQVRLIVMQDLLWEKFQNPFLREMLLATDDAILIESNYWQDNFWGICTCKRCPGDGENHLGRLLMETRAKIRQEIDHD